MKDKQGRLLYDYLKKNRMTYREYLQSAHWQDVRRRFWNSRLHKKACEVCGSKTHLQVHHRTYKRIGAEHLTDLNLLCDDCHEGVHRMLKTGKSKGGLRRAVRWFRKQKIQTQGDKNV